MARSLVIITLAIGLSVAAVGGVLARWHWELAGGVNALDATADLEIGDPIYEIDPGDDRALAAYVTDIFIGNVLRQTGAVGADLGAGAGDTAIPVRRGCLACDQRQGRGCGDD